VAGQTSFDCSDLGTNTVTLTVTDVNGNVSTCSAVVTVIDNTNPVITCPADITLNAPAGQCSTAVNYNVTATDNCSATVTVSPASGSVFNFGTTTVNAVATDASGNTANCSFTVTVNGNGAVTFTGIPADLSLVCGAAIPAAPAIVPCGSNGNGCPANPICFNGFTYLGDYNGSRYYVSNGIAPWNQANSGAQSIGGNLVTLNNSAENNWLNTQLSGSAQHWIGLNDATTEGSFVWASGISSSYTNWASGQPNNQNNQDFAAFNASSGKWSDFGTADCYKYIVEFPCSSAPVGVSATSLCGPCPTVTFSEVTVAGNCAGNYQIIRTWTATSNGIVLGTSTQTITVTDNVAPVITCPANPCVAAAQGQCGAPVNFNATATDNCSGVTVTYSIAPGSVFPVGTTAVTATATDGCGNTSTCTFNVIVTDNQNPVITCPANITVNAPAGQCSTAVNYNVTATDNCSATVSVSPASGTVFGFGTTTVNATATDPAGNTATCSFTVTVIGSGAATFTGIPANVTLACGAAIPAAPAIVPCGGNGGGNGCPTNPASYSGFTFLGDYNGTRYYLSTNATTWSSANSAANSIGAKLVTIESSAENNWLDAQLGSSGSFWIGLNDAASEGNFVWTSGSSASYRNWNAGEPNNSGNEDYVEFSASNGKWNDLGNSSSCVNRNYVIELPCIVGGGSGNGGGSTCGGSSSCSNHNSSSCTGSSGNCGGNNCSGHHNSSNCGGYSGYCSGNACGGNHNNNSCGGNSNNCGGSSCSGHHNNSSCSGNGSYCGGSSCNGNHNHSNCGNGGNGGNGGNNGGVSATSLCGPCPTVTMSEVTVAGNCPGNYQIIRTWTATSNGIVVGTATQTITVVDNTAPALVGVPANVTASCGNLPAVPNVTAHDACDPSVAVTYNQTITGAGCNQVVTRTWTATDDCGNVATASQTITVSDNVAPTISCPSNPCVAAAQGQCGAPVNFSATANDNCSGVTVTYSIAPGSVFPVGTTAVTATATDACGNTKSCTFNVIVTDNQNPVITCPANITVNAPAGQCSTAVNYNVTATDNCSATVSVSPASGSVFGGGTTTVNAVATDPSGNTANCSFTVTVNGGASVAINCPANITTTCSAGGSVVTWQVPTATITGCGANSCPTNPVCYNGFTYIGDYNGSRYYRSNNGTSWTSANSAAQAIGGHLVTLNSAAENNWLDAQIGSSVVWIGINDIATEGNFVWSSGISSSYTNWASGEPNNSGGNQDYGVLDGGANKWYDRANSDCNNYIVELPCSGGVGNVTVTQIGGPAPGSVFPAGVTTITYQASNGAGATATCSFTVTVEEVFEVICPGNITIPCTPGCGPNGSNGGVVTWNTPTVIWESCSANICQPNNCINGFTYLGEYNGHRYFVSNAGANSWSSARSAAVNLGADLVTINNSAENAWLDGALNNSNVYWIGLNDASVEGTFVWSSGSSASYRNFASGEPNNGGGNSDYAVIAANGGLWYDRAGSDCNAYIIEFDCDGYSLVQTSGPANGSFQAPGTYTVSYTATTTTGLVETCSFNVTVQSCAASYCTPSGTTCYEWINQVAVSNLNNWSGNNNGYANFTQNSATVNRGSNYSMTLRPAFANTTYNETWRVYADWNQDGDFNDSGELEFTVSGTGVVYGTLSIPSSAPLGSTRMRVVMRYEQCSAYNGPCSNVGYGEVEDYTLIVNGTSSRVVAEPNGTSESEVANAAASAESGQSGIVGDHTGLRLTKIFPVPTERDLNLEFLSLIEGEVEIEVMDLNGKVMMKSTQDLRTANNYVKLDVSRLPMATYMVKVSNGKESFTEKFVRQ
jgi:hypothetical protein